MDSMEILAQAFEVSNISACDLDERGCRCSLKPQQKPARGEFEFTKPHPFFRRYCPVSSLLGEERQMLQH